MARQAGEETVWSAVVATEIVRSLQETLEHWGTSRTRWERAVREVIEAAIEEWEV